MTKKFERLRQVGLRKAIICCAKKFLFRLLAYWFGFDRWHASAPFECRPYKQEVVDLANSVHPNCVLEIGCGLGEIVSRVDSRLRFGMDADAKVLAAARYLYGASCKFVVGSLGDTRNIAESAGACPDLVILVNWPHGIGWPELRPQILKLVDLFDVSYLLVDGINAAVSGYKYHHGETEFTDCGRILRKVPSSDKIRTLYLISVASS